MRTSTSAPSTPCAPCVGAKASAAASPAAAASQKARGGRSCARSTATAAVAAGSIPTITLACADERCFSAMLVKIGKPITTPRPTSAKRGRSSRAGRGWRVSLSRAAARTAATSARPSPTNVGSRSLTASRVAGSENENASTPSAPYATAARTLPAASSRAACVTGPPPVALLTFLMLNGNSDGGVIARALEEEVLAGAPGDRLPSVRELMARHRAGPATVQRAIAALASRGLVEARPGRGTFVAARASAAVAPDVSWQTVALGPRAIDANALEALIRPPDTGTLVLSAGYLPADLQPAAALGAAMARAARRPGVWDRVPLEGLPGLRAHFAAALGASAGDVLITSGGQAALSACLRGLAARGSAVLVEAPTYVGALAAARAMGLRPVPVPADASGVRPDLLADALASTGARVVYLQPLLANPHGGTLGGGRRAEGLAAGRWPPPGGQRGRSSSRTTRSGSWRSGRSRRRCSVTMRTGMSCTCAR